MPLGQGGPCPTLLAAREEIGDSVSPRQGGKVATRGFFRSPGGQSPKSEQWLLRWEGAGKAA